MLVINIITLAILLHTYPETDNVLSTMIFFFFRNCMLVLCFDERNISAIAFDLFHLMYILNDYFCHLCANMTNYTNESVARNLNVLNIFYQYISSRLLLSH